MGDYYKLKKILLILFIIFTILRILNTSRVFGADDVNSSIQSGNYVVQTDNHFYTIKDLTRSFQDKHCIQLMVLLKQPDSYAAARVTCKKLYDIMISKDRTIFFYTISTAKGFLFQEIPISSLVNSNITISGYTLDNGYNFNNVAFVNFTRNSTYPGYYVNPYSAEYGINSTSGSISCALPSLGFLSTLWADVFREAGFLGTSGEYNSLLNEISDYAEGSYIEAQNQTYLQNQTNTTITNTYNYLNNENVDEITSLGFSSPDIEEKIDLNDVFDQFETLLTDENYTPKQFSFWLPNGDESVFSISPTMLEDNLTRVGGSSIVSIIHAIWFISLYGWYIFAYFGILGKLISGDWFHLVRGQSPITRMVKFSVGSVTGNVRF